ncbi:unnamed protein product [Kuraishia capsulata CBS 1993]|uniref:Zn(2)-C6 fungal-type domain-containing protein n=1 Tax=Kuraishia capsulata CBS 1993 TaxID=1382522 RepID=W6MUJ5_9ASCO|nr:uncharacterized protein KUCA_T00005320001 [Kuraishia capsulata CBS 1993]CDK29332.1 unnamed protein product [Kuraishia capsulata CBS 1993]
MSNSLSQYMSRGSGLKPRRSREGCASCKKLKIKCDESKPSCEYCVQTNRACVYPSAARWCVKTSFQQVRKDIYTLQPDLDITAMTGVLNCSKADLHSLHFFVNNTVWIFSLGRSALISNSFKEMSPVLFRNFEMYKESAMALGTLHSWSKCFGRDSQTALSLNRLREVAVSHFKKAVWHAGNFANRLGHLDLEKMTEQEKEALYITNNILFAYVHLDPTLCELALGSEETDALAFCQAVTSINRLLVPWAIESPRMRPLLYLGEYAQPIPLDLEYPFTKRLMDQLNEYYFSEEIDMSSYKELETSIMKLKAVTFLSIKFEYFMPFFRFLGSVSTDKFRHLINEENDPMAIIVMLYYAAMAIFADYSFSEKENQWSRFMTNARGFLQERDLRENGKHGWVNSVEWLYGLSSCNYRFRIPEEMKRFGNDIMVELSS